MPVAEPAGRRAKKAVTCFDNLGDFKVGCGRCEVAACETDAELTEVGFARGIRIQANTF